MGKKKYDPQKAYNQSKLALIMFTMNRAILDKNNIARDLLPFSGCCNKRKNWEDDQTAINA
jgi:hypothetical protein